MPNSSARAARTSSSLAKPFSIEDLVERLVGLRTASVLQPRQVRRGEQAFLQQTVTDVFGYHWITNPILSLK